MAIMTVDPLVTDSLRRLEAAAATLPRHRREELLAEIREPVDSALLEAGQTDEVAVRNVLERLGPPALNAADSGPHPGTRRNPEIPPAEGLGPLETSLVVGFGLFGGLPTALYLGLQLRASRMLAAR